jgi:hypothetical protein
MLLNVATPDLEAQGKAPKRTDRIINKRVRALFSEFVTRNHLPEVSLTDFVREKEQT